MVCPITVKRVTPFSASEAVARDVKNGAIPSTLSPLLARVGSKHGGLVGQPRHSVYWVLIDMPLLVSGGPSRLLWSGGATQRLQLRFGQRRHREVGVVCAMVEPGS